MICDICGKTIERGFWVLIEGSKLFVCEECKKFGSVLDVPQERIVKNVEKKKEFNKEEIKIEPLENFHELIRKKREELKMTQKQFGMFLNEKEAFIHKLESGEIVPPLDVLRKIEKKLGIKLTKEIKAEIVQNPKSPEVTLTLGDLLAEKMKIKKE
ncbi:MAG: multiprotein bridging factor aMBF1 [Candidatus Woesearchaeota archaeon]